MRSFFFRYNFYSMTQPAKKISKNTLDKYKLIVDEWFVNGFNGTKAYQKLYPKSKVSTADSNFRKILGITRIENYISEKKEKAENLLRTKHEGILQELKNWAYSDITQTLLLDPQSVKELPPEVRRLITKFKHTKRNLTNSDGEIFETIEHVELSFVSKEKAMEMIGKHVGFYGADNEQKNLVVIESREERDAYIKSIQDKILKNADS